MSDSLPSKDELRETAVAYQHAEADFELPLGSSDVRCPVLSPSEYVTWCEQMREALNLPTDDPDRRLALKTSKEFVW